MAGSRSVTTQHCKVFILSYVHRVLLEIPERMLLKTRISCLVQKQGEKLGCRVLRCAKMTFHAIILNQYALELEVWDKIYPCVKSAF